MNVEIIKTNPAEFYGVYEVEKYLGQMLLRNDITQEDYDNLMTGLYFFHNDIGRRSRFHLVRKDGHVYADVAEPMTLTLSY